MKHTWTWFVTGMFLVALVFAAVRDRYAGAEDPRVKHLEDSSISGLKVEVPTKLETESAISIKEKELVLKEARIKESEERLAFEEARLNEKVAEFEKLQEEIQSLHKKNKIESEEMLKRMVKTFETMSPKKAAGVVSLMKDDLAIEVLMNMKEKKVAAVMEVMDPSRAMSLSSLMAMRKPAGKAVGEGQIRPK